MIRIYIYIYVYLGFPMRVCNQFEILDLAMFSWDQWGSLTRAVFGLNGIKQDHQLYRYIHWIGLRENLQETMVFTIKYRAFL